MRKIDPGLHEQLTKLINSMGYEFVGADLVPEGRQSAFRIFVDKEGGVTVDDCSLISRQVSAMMDVEDPIQGRYLLEVSSPGIDRPLFTIEHYTKQIGSQIKVRLHAPVNGRKQYKGTLTQVEGDDIYLSVEGQGEEIKLSFNLIEKANVIGQLKL